MVTFINPYTIYRNANQWTIITGGVASSAMTMQVNADIRKGAKINAFLQPEGKDRVNIEGRR